MPSYGGHDNATLLLYNIQVHRHIKVVSADTYITYIFIHQTGSHINNNNRKLNYKHLTEYYNLLQNWQKPFTIEIYVVV